MKKKNRDNKTFTCREQMEILNRIEKRGKVSSTGRLSLTTGVKGSTKNHPRW